MKHFKPYEFACRCGKCGLGISDMDAVLLNQLDYAREIAGRSFYITSGIRCEAHNAASGGVVGSSHTKGMAVDIRTKDSSERAAVLRGVLSAGFNRVGIHEKFIHVDVDPAKPGRVCWLYEVAA